MKAFTRFFLLSVFALQMFQSCFHNSKTINGNGNLLRQEVEIADYNEISLKISADIFYRNDSISSPYLQVYTDENIIPYINIDVQNGCLIVNTKEGVNLKATHLKLITNSTNLNMVSVSGSGKVELKGEVNAKEMRVDISGSGSLSADSLYCEQANLSVSGSGKINLKGVSNATDFEVSGSGNINTLEFSSLDANATVSGSGHIVLWAGRKLNAAVSGSGGIQYKGYPEIKKEEISGSGSISLIE